VLYHGREEVVVREERKYAGFSGDAAKNQSVTLAERVSQSVKSLIVYGSDAFVDGVHRADVVASSLQPVLTVSSPPDVPEGVNMKGVNPAFGENVYWRHSVAFSHQLAFSRFESRIYQDPAISLVVPLLLPQPSALVNPLLFVMSAAVISVVYVLLKVTLKRWPHYLLVGNALGITTIQDFPCIKMRNFASRILNEFTQT